VDEDELSNAISDENSRNIKFGIAAGFSGGLDLASIATIQGSASANFGIESNVKKAEEISHKHSREQSERISNEIRRNYKSTFRTSVETTDTSSRRYVLQNTSDKVVNYELRRKNT
jgi:hypothetical protein